MRDSKAEGAVQKARRNGLGVKLLVNCLLIFLQSKSIHFATNS